MMKPKTSEVILLDLFKESIINFKRFKVSLNKLAQIKTLKSEIVKLIYNKAKEINQIRKEKKEGENK